MFYQDEYGRKETFRRTSWHVTGAGKWGDSKFVNLRAAASPEGKAEGRLSKKEKASKNLTREKRGEIGKKEKAHYKKSCEKLGRDYH